MRDEKAMADLVSSVADRPALAPVVVRLRGQPPQARDGALSCPSVERESAGKVTFSCGAIWDVESISCRCEFVREPFGNLVVRHSLKAGRSARALWWESDRWFPRKMAVARPR